jgi:hypothetical protein
VGFTLLLAVGFTLSFEPALRVLVDRSVERDAANPTLLSV